MAARRVVEEHDPLAPAEGPTERAQRNFSELVQELRVAGLGIQVLFGFLLALPFEDPHFSRLSGAQVDLYLADVLVAAFATVALGAPVAYHRLVFRHHRKERLVHFANGLVLVGLGLVALAVSLGVGLVASAVAHGPAVPALCAVVFGAFAAFWLLIALAGRE